MDDAIDLDLDAAAGLASLASSGMKTAPSGKGKPRAPRKPSAAPKPKKGLTPGQRAAEAAKRHGEEAVETKTEPKGPVCTREHAAASFGEAVPGVGRGRG